MSSGQTERMAVNASIAKLIARSPELDDAAHTVIAYGSKLESSRRLELYADHDEWIGAVNKDRVGYYRLWKETGGLLHFHEFRKPPVFSLRSDLGDEYLLAYDPETLKLRYFGMCRQRILFSFRLGLTIEIARKHLELICGSDAKWCGFDLRIYN